MEKEKLINKLKDFLLACIAAAALLLLAAFGIYRCPLDLIFGIPCPMCGMTRALISLLRLDASSAFYYHPLWPLLIVSVVVYILHYFEVIKISKLLSRVICIALCVILIGCYVLRHILHSPIVAVHFEDSLIYRILSFSGAVFQS